MIVAPTSQRSLTPGELELAFWIQDLHRSTKDLSSPVSYSSETTDGNWDLETGTEAFFFFSFSHKPLEPQKLDTGGKKNWHV